MLGGLISGVIGGVGASMVDLANQAQEEAKEAKKAAAALNLLKVKSSLEIAKEVKKGEIKVKGDKEVEEFKQIGRKELESIKSANDIAIEKLRGQNSINTKATPTALNESEKFELDTRKTLKELLKDPEKNAAEIEKTEQQLRAGKGGSSNAKQYTPVYQDVYNKDTLTTEKKVFGFNGQNNTMVEPSLSVIPNHTQYTGPKK